MNRQTHNSECCFRLGAFFPKALPVAFLSFATLSCSVQTNLAKKNIAWDSQSLRNSKVLVYSTAKGTDQRLTLTDSLTFAEMNQPIESDACIFVDPNKQFQHFLGIGGAITDASAEVYARLPVSSQGELLRAYYDRNNGIGYSLIRTNINSCDFSSESYSYVSDLDITLKSFNIKHDLQYRIPLIKKAIAQAHGSITLYGSPWSPPAWMKDNNNMLHGGKLLPQYRQVWASYLADFIKAYAKEGIPVWGLTVQNEPMAIQTWESCNYTAQEEGDFVKSYLGPTLRRNGLSDKKIIIWDHNRDLLFQRASTILNDPEASKYVWGVGFHWYVRDVFDNVKQVHEAFPEKNLLFTEGCCERFDANTIKDWKWGELYGKSMINDFNNGSVGWTDWNILLDQQGGPNHVGNFCFAPVHANTETGALTFMNSYYYIGHFSKFIRPGANRVSCSSNREELLSTAFLNKDGNLVVVVQNATDGEITYSLWIDGQAVKKTSLPHSINTLILKKANATHTD